MRCRLEGDAGPDLVLAAKLAQSIGNQPRSGRSGIAKRSVCLLIWHCLTSEDAGHCNASLLPRELLKHFTGAIQGFWRVLRPEHLAHMLQSVSRRSRDSLHPSSFPFDLTRGDGLRSSWLAERLCRGSWPPSGIESGDAMPRNRRNGSLGWMDPLFISVSKLGKRQKPVAAIATTTTTAA